MSTHTPKSDTPALGSPAWLRKFSDTLEGHCNSLDTFLEQPIPPEYKAQIAALRAAAEALEKLERENAALRDLIGHAHLHAAYRNCGYRQMTTEQKALFDSVTRQWHEDLNREGQSAAHEVSDKLASIPAYPTQQTEWRGAEL